jgi:hypothetical protein
VARALYSAPTTLSNRLSMHALMSVVTNPPFRRRLKIVAGEGEARLFPRLELDHGEPDLRDPSARTHGTAPCARRRPRGFSSSLVDAATPSRTSRAALPSKEVRTAHTPRMASHGISRPPTTVITSSRNPRATSRLDREASE